MKKFFLVVAIMVAFSANNASAQFWKNALNRVVEDVVDNVTSSDDNGVLGNVLGSLLGQAVTLSEETLQGTWEYEGVACVLESENALADIGGTVVTSTVEEKLDGYLSKVGVAPGTCSFTFLQNDSCVFTVAGRGISGKYTLNAEEKKINFHFVYDRMTIRTHVAYNVTSMNIIFDADKLLNLIKNVTSGISNGAAGIGEMASGQQTTLGTSTAGISSTLSTVGALLNNYDGMMLGMKLKKQ